MTDRGLGVLVSVLSVLMLVLILTMTIQKSFFERDKDGYSAFERMTGSAEDELTVSGGYSMQQAYAICKKRAVEQIGINLLSLHFDAASSRFHQFENAFEVFLEAEIRNDGKDHQEFVMCKVSASSSRVIEYKMKTVKGIWGNM